MNFSTNEKRNGYGADSNTSDCPRHCQADPSTPVQLQLLRITLAGFEFGSSNCASFATPEFAQCRCRRSISFIHSPIRIPAACIDLVLRVSNSWLGFLGDQSALEASSVTLQFCRFSKFCEFCEVFSFSGVLVRCTRCNLLKSGAHACCRVLYRVSLGRKFADNRQGRRKLSFGVQASEQAAAGNSNYLCADGFCETRVRVFSRDFEPELTLSVSKLANVFNLSPWNAHAFTMTLFENRAAADRR